MSSPEEAKREATSPLERETGERDVHPEEEGHPEPSTSGTTADQAGDERAGSEESPG
jgi:hypothetical protein